MWSRVNVTVGKSVYYKSIDVKESAAVDDVDDDVDDAVDDDDDDSDAEDYN